MFSLSLQGVTVDWVVVGPCMHPWQRTGALEAEISKPKELVKRWHALAAP